MSTLSLYQFKAMLDAVFGSGTPATFHFALFTTAPTIAGTGGVEVTGGSYARAAVTNNASNFPAATDNGTIATKTLGNAVAFPTATANWGTVVAVGIYDASTGGNLRGFALVTSQSVPTGVTATVNAGATITLAAAA